MPRDFRNGRFLALEANFVFPDSHDDPSASGEQLANFLIPPHVPFDFPVPKLVPAFRAAVVFRATVPETTINEDGDLFAGKNKVGLTR